MIKLNKNLTRIVKALNTYVEGFDINQVDPRKIIRTDKQFDRKIASEAMKKVQVKALSIAIDYNKYSGKTSAIVAVSGLVQARTVDIENCHTVFIRDKNRIAKRDNFTWQSISLKLSDAANQQLGEIVFGGTIAVFYNPETGWVNVFLEKKSGAGDVKYFSLEDGKEYAYANVMRRYADCEILKFELDPVTASGSRNGSGVFRNVTEEDTRFEIFNKATCGGLKKQRTRIIEKLASVKNAEELRAVEKQFKKDYGYLGNVGTGSFNAGIVKGYHVYEGKYLNDTPETFLTDEFIDTLEALNLAVASDVTETEGRTESLAVINQLSNKLDELEDKGDKLKDAATQDGQMYIEVIELCIMIYESTGYIVDPSVLIGRMLQIRPATIKASALVVDTHVYQQILKGSEELAEKHKTKVTPYRDKDRSLFIADMNCIKLEFDFEEEFTFEILAFNKTSEGHASKQMYKNFMYAAQKLNRLQECLDLIRELERLTISEKIVEAIDTNRPAIMPTPNDVLKAMKTGYYTDLMRNTAPSFTRQSKHLMESSWKQVINSAVKAIDRMHGKVKVESRRLASDPTFIITGGKLSGILKLGQSFINDRNIKKSVMFKYPVAGLEEQYPSENVLLATIIKAVKKNVKSNTITKEEGDAIISFYGGLKRTVRVLPALMFLANACAGLDFDYDGECSVIRTENPTTRSEEITNIFVDMLFENGMRGVSIKM